MNEDTQALIRTLATGQKLPVSDELLDALQALDLDYCQQDESVRLDTPLELLDASRIGDALSPDTRHHLSQLDVFWQIDSTNTWLLGRAAQPDFHGSVCLAEQQVAGKGRRGRHWVSPFGKNIYLSLGWRISTLTTSVAGLSLVVGMQVAQVLRSLGMDGVGLKWPNDVLLGDGKLAGILVEVAASPRNEARLVIGIGVNLRLSPREAGLIDQQFSTIAQQMDVSRNLLVADLLNRLVPALVDFQGTGFAPWAEHWSAFDVYTGKPVKVSLVNGDVHGIDRGVDATGNLLLETDSGLEAFNAGEVSLRPVN